MAELRIERRHGLSPQQALGLAERWVQQAHTDWSMPCTAMTCGPGSHGWRFARPGVSGELRVDGEQFALELKLGFLLSAYQHKIRQQIEANLDEAIRSVS
jgi:putative polyhydroxyalkanoate system protein